MSVVRQLLSGLMVIWLAVSLTFFVLRWLPGDAISGQLAGTGASIDEIEALQDRMGINQTPIMQYVSFWTDLIRGDLGYSLVNYQPVTQLIGDRLLPTITLAGWALLVASVSGVLMGILAAYDYRIADFIINLSISTPLYWTGTLAIILFSAQLGWLPSAGVGTANHLIMPVGVLGFHTMGEIARVIQVNVAEVRYQPFVTVARSKGLTNHRITFYHVLRVGLLPVLTVITLQFGFLLGGTVITESLFVRPGIGRLMLDSVINQDYPVVQGLVILSAVTYTLLNTLTDLSYRLIDPRL